MPYDERGLLPSKEDVKKKKIADAYNKFYQKIGFIVTAKGHLKRLRTKEEKRTRA